ncbi:MAG: hypothetical protein SGCHY_001033 [Lobulomycetales sp.]
MIQIRPGSKLPVGLDSFRCVVLQDYTFVDKSLLIQEFIAASDLVSLVLRPRRFGKSMNLDMLRHSFLLSHSRYFFEKVPAETPDTWCNRRDLFNGLLIETQFPELFDAHFAKYPCIHFSMKGFKATSWPLMFREIKNLVSELFHSHNYLEQHLDKDNLQQFRSIVDRDPDYTKISLKFLSQLLTKYHGSPCIVLIDEYDAPLNCAFKFNDRERQGYEFLKEAKTFFGALFSGLLKSNDANIYKALLVGVLPVANSELSSGLNASFPMYKERYCDKFGFTQAETDSFIAHHPVDHEPNDISDWYNSYSATSSKSLYNPWSIVSLCGGNLLKSYWGGTGMMPIIHIV